MNPRTEQPWLDTEAASHTMRVYRKTLNWTDINAAKASRPDHCPRVTAAAIAIGMAGALYLGAVALRFLILAFGG